jgi:hypothetical protein
MSEGEGNIVYRTARGYAYFWFTMESKPTKGNPTGERYPIYRVVYNSGRDPLAVNTMGLVRGELGADEIPEPEPLKNNQYRLF